jgi:histidinol-phosphate aminotransferase
MNSEFSRRNFLKKSVLAAGAAGALQAAAPQAFAKPTPAKAKATAPESTPAVINLGANTLSIGPSKKAIEAIVKYAPMSGGYEPTDTGELVGILSKQLGVPADHISVYPGSGTPLDLVVMAFTGPKGSLVTADPTYEQGWRTSQRAGAKLIKVPQRKDCSHDVEAMCAADPSAGMLYICNPNNPTGAITMRKDIEYAVKNKPASATLVVDEAYIHFSDNAKSAVDLVAAGENVVVLRTFSKLYGMAGLRLGYAVGSPENLNKMNGGSGRSQGVVAATTIGAGVASLSDPELIPARKALIKKQRTETIAWLEKQGYPCTPSEANHFQVDVKRSGKDFQTDMATWGVNVGRTWPGFETWSRVSLGTEAEMARFREAFAQVMTGARGPIAPPQRDRRAGLETQGLLHHAAFRDEQVDLMPARESC